MAIVPVLFDRLQVVTERTACRLFRLLKRSDLRLKSMSGNECLWMSHIGSNI